MANKTFVLVLAGTAALLSSCSPLMYASVEENSLTITQAIPAVPAIPVALPPDLTQTLMPPIDFQISDIGVTADDAKDSSLWLNGAQLVMLNHDPTTTFAGITAASLTIVPPSGTTLPAVVVADFDSTRDGTATTTLALKSTGKTNLLPYLEQKSMQIQLFAAGTTPGGPANATWDSDLTLDFHIIAQKNVL